jgi:hypothetical protein
MQSRRTALISARMSRITTGHYSACANIWTYGGEYCQLLILIHLQFVLKHIELQHCREHRDFANSLCPSNEGKFSYCQQQLYKYKIAESFAIVAQMLDQIIDFHTNISSIIHIGCDEVSE